MAKIITLTPQEASVEWQKRLEEARSYRNSFENQWLENEEVLLTLGRQSVGPTPDSDNSFYQGSSGGGDSEINLNYAMKYVRYIHAQMSANPPVVQPIPTSQDVEDRQTAIVADHIIHHGYNKQNAQEYQDVVALDTLYYGTGWGRCMFNPMAGEMTGVDKKTHDVRLEGEIQFERVSPWDVWVDSEADGWDKCRYVFVRRTMPLEQALYLWPQHKDQLSGSIGQGKARFFSSRVEDARDQGTREIIEIYEYIEKGLPWNGMRGRHGWMLDTGLILEEPSSNPFPNACIPLFPLTDIDVPGQIYGKAVVDYLTRAQEVLAALDSTVLDNIQAHGVVRLVLPDGAEIQDDGINNMGWEYVGIKGNAGTAPFFMNPPTLMPDIYRFREQLLMGMEALAGVNESMFGQQSREMSAVSMQTAIQAGNMIRRRLFNKYTKWVRANWMTYLENVKKHWSVPRKILVTGTEGALSIAYYDASNLSGGYDLQADYGTSFSLDPAQRREEILGLAPLLKEAGWSANKILEKIRLNDVQGVYDINELARSRQLELFEEMISKYESGMEVYIPPRKYQEHKSMLAFAYDFVMTRRYFDFDEELKALIERHMEEREQMEVEEAGQQAPPAAPPMPGGGMPPMPGMPPM